MGPLEICRFRRHIFLFCVRVCVCVFDLKHTNSKVGREVKKKKKKKLWRGSRNRATAGITMSSEVLTSLLIRIYRVRGRGSGGRGGRKRRHTGRLMKEAVGKEELWQQAGGRRRVRPRSSSGFYHLVPDGGVAAAAPVALWVCTDCRGGSSSKQKPQPRRPSGTQQFGAVLTAR